LLRCAGVLRGLAVTGTAPDVDYVASNLVIAHGAVGYLPRVYLSILVVSYQTLYTPVQVDHIGVADLLPATPTLGYGGGMPLADLVTADRPPLGRSGAVDNEVL